MSLRRKLALWLCPELRQPEETQCIGSAQAWAENVSAMSTLCRVNAVHATREADEAVWKAGVLEQLKAMNAQMAQLVESSRAASEHVRNAARNLHEVTEGGNAMKVVNRLS